MDQQPTQSFQSTDTPQHNNHRQSFFQKKSNIIAILAVLIVIAAIPLTVKFSQQRQEIRQHAAGETPAQYCRFDPWTAAPDWLLGNGVLGSFKLRHGPNYFDQEKQNEEEPGPVIAAGDEVATTKYKFDMTVDWRIPNGTKMIVKYDPWNDVLRTEFSGRSFDESAWSRFLRGMNDSAFTTEVVTKQISTEILEKYTIMGLVRTAIDNLSDPQGGSTDSPGTSATKSEQNLQRFLSNDPNLKVEMNIGTLNKPANEQQNITRTSIKGQTITIDLISRVIGFDVTGLKDELNKTLGSAADRKARMIAETSSCVTIPTPQPTSSTPVSCDENLLVPPADFAVNVPSLTSPICPAATEIVNGQRRAEELFRCGDYWVKSWCNATNDTQRQDVVYACRGWSQTGDGLPNGTDSFYRYFPNRILTVTTAQGVTGPGGALASNISKYGDVRGRRITWNSLMQEVKSGMIAFPYGYRDVAGALQAASSAIFEKPWSAITEQERLNNCSTTWDGALTPAPTLPPVTSGPVPSSAPSTAPSGTPSTSPNPNGTVLNFIVMLHGIGAAGDVDSADNKTSTPNPTQTTRNATVIVSDVNDSPESKKEIRTTMTYVPMTPVTANSGKYTVSADISSLNLPTGNYTVRIKTDNFLSGRVNSGVVQIVAGQANSMPTVQERAGDATNDNVLSIDDYNIMRNCVSVLSAPRSCTPEQKTASDFNDDGKVDNEDYYLLLRELAKRNGE